MAKTMVVVGNAEPTVDLSEIIDDADEVVRFQMAFYYPLGLTGTKTTALAFRGASTGTGKDLSTGKLPLSQEALAARPELWVMRSDGWGMHAPRKLSWCNLHHVEVAPFFARYPQMSELPIRFVDMSARTALKAYFWRRRRFKGHVEPTGGLWVLQWLLSQTEFAEYTIQVTGFTGGFRGHHPEGLERELLKRWVRGGRLHPIGNMGDIPCE